MLIHYLQSKRGVALGLSATLLFSAGNLTAYGQGQALLKRHTRDAVTQGQTSLVQHLNASQTLHLAIQLPLRNQEQLNSFLENLYNPNSPNYKHYLSVEEFTNWFGPTQDDYNSVLAFAHDNGLVVTHTSPNRVLIQVDASVASIERAFNVTMNVYQHPTEARTFYAPDREPTVNLAAKLWYVAGLDNYSIPRPNVSQKVTPQPETTGSGPGGYFLGSDLRKAYYPSPGTLTGTGQKMALLEYVGYDTFDYTNYFNTYGPPLTATITGISTDGTPVICTTCEDAEQSLDIEYAISMAPGMSELRVYVGGSDSSILNRMATDNVAKVISCSWSWRPADPTVDDPIFQQMAAQGQTFLTATGDSGSWNTSDLYWWPADSANVVGVGGTSLVTNGAGGTWKSETGWADSGGGITLDNIAIPVWQHNKKVINNKNHGSKTLRNGPDISMEGDFQNWICADNTCNGGWGGTSFAAPEFAAYLVLANQQAVAHSHPTVGFVNPAVYAIGIGAAYTSNFHDILTGSNGGFSCVRGYDLVTGWGSANGATLINTLAP